MIMHEVRNGHMRTNSAHRGPKFPKIVNKFSTEYLNGISKTLQTEN